MANTPDSNPSKELPPDEPADDEQEPPQTWKHPDDGKSLSDQDEERPLKP
ncbi:hypothetical protein [Pseudomonas sp. R5(2019)]|nr:hypothetical protein [Pseudomonas sp. R5(2019)]